MLVCLGWSHPATAQFLGAPQSDPNAPSYPVTDPGDPSNFAPPPDVSVEQPLQVNSAPAIEGEPVVEGSYAGDAKEYEEGKVVAIVGNQHILYGDIVGMVNLQMETYYDQIRKGEAERLKQGARPMTQRDKEMLEQQLGQVREQATRASLNAAVDSKIYYQEFERELKGKAKDKAAEARADIKRKVRKAFDEALQKAQTAVAKASRSEIEEMAKQDPTITRLALMMRDKQLETLAALDLELRRTGSSLQKQVDIYGESALGRSLFPTRIDMKPDVNYLEMLNYYKANPEKYAVAAKARWEHLMVKYSSYKSKEEAYKQISDMGNKVFFGAPFDAVARQFSEDSSAAKGGYHDWTNQGVLASTELDNALFTLEVGKLSQIIADNRGYHILRVVERKDAGFIPFLEAQVEIKEAIETQKRQDSFKKFILEMKEKTKIWTIYDEEDAAKQQLARPAGQRQQR